MESPSRDGNWDEEMPDGELAAGRGGGFSKTQEDGADGQLQKQQENIIKLWFGDFESKICL